MISIPTLLLMIGCFALGRFVERLAWNKLIQRGSLPRPNQINWKERF